jgi:hypothetical protein
MFPIEEDRIVDTDLPLIVSNYRVLLCDEGLPILFTGTNRYGNYVVGSSVDENYEDGVERYFHILVEPTDYLLFKSRKLSYLELLTRAKPIFVVDKLINEDANRIFQINIEEVPDDHRPSEQALYPISAYEPTYRYSTSLIGGIADTNHAVPEDVSETQNSIAEAIDSAFNSLSRWLGVGHERFLVPATGGSFKINYEVRVTDFPSLFQSEAEYLKYLNDYLKYCFDGLSADANQLADLKIEGLEKFNNLIRRLHDLQEGSKLLTSEAEIRESVINDLTTTARALQSVAKVVGRNYKSIAVANVADNDEHPLGVITEDFHKQIKDAATVLNESIVVRKTEVRDEEIKEYFIHVFEFNKNKGTGWAYLKDPEDETRNLTVAISVTPYSPQAPSKFSTSLDRSQYINVRGVLTIGKFRSKLVIKGEEVE